MSLPPLSTLWLASQGKENSKGAGNGDATESFADHPNEVKVFSDLMQSVSGERVKNVRSAVGKDSLPGGIAVEVEVTVEIEE
jgi:hypothetical protein